MNVAMESEKVVERLRALVQQVCERLPNDLAVDSRFREDCELDSLDLVEYVARVEQDFGVLIADEDIVRFTSLRASADYLRERLAT